MRGDAERGPLGGWSKSRPDPHETPDAFEYGLPPSSGSTPRPPHLDYNRPSGPGTPRRAGRGPAVLIVAVLAIAGLVGAIVAALPALENADSASERDGSTGSNPQPTYGVADPGGEIHDGLWRVGIDIDPGTYRAAAPIERDRDGYGCYWTAYSGSDHSFENIVGSGVDITGLPALVLTGATEFESSGCGQLQRVDPATLFGNLDAPVGLPSGAWLIGEDFAPGVYRTAAEVSMTGDGGGSRCDWSIFTGASQAEEDLVDWGMVSGGRPILRLDAGQSFNSRGCGDWVPVDPAGLFQSDDAPRTIAEGVWFAGEDFAPGTYVANPTFGPENVYGYCYWAIAESWEAPAASGTSSDFSDKEGQRAVTLTVGQRFESEGCGDWKPQGS